MRLRIEPNPAIVIVRDRVSYARLCVEALLRAGLEVHVVDHESTYEPCLKWLSMLETSGLVSVHRRKNVHPRDLWRWHGLRQIVGDRRYIVTDPDVVPDENCPSDWFHYMDSVLDEHPGWLKIGFNLRTDDLPSHYVHAETVKEWEAQWYTRDLGVDVRPKLYQASVDTTLALYRSLNECDQFSLAPALRTDRPYLARHLTWYEDSANPTDEEIYYRNHVTPLVSHWQNPTAYVENVVEAGQERSPARPGTEDQEGRGDRR